MSRAVLELKLRISFGFLACAGALWAQPGLAQTWVGGRSGPALTEIFAIDATGEPAWLYGAEDVAGDGIDVFKQQEQSIDIRTAYAATDAQRFWVRVYVSDANAAGGNVTGYVFIDADRNAGTGGPAAAPEIDAKLAPSSVAGGYEYVVGIRGNASIGGVWQWNGGASQYQTKNVNPSQASAETGSVLDPILINTPAHGYLQANINLGEVGLTEQCTANLYVRTVNETAALGAGDLEVGQVGPCVPADGDSDGVPDLTVPKSGCTSDAQCPNGGVCVSGKCVLAVPCAVDGDCPAGRTCQAGRCVFVPSGNCTTNSECNGLWCNSGQCAACTMDDQCGAGRRCGPDGRCISASGGGTGGAGVTLDPEDEIQGGACTCGTAPARGAGGLLLLLSPLLFALRRRSRRAALHRS